MPSDSTLQGWSAVIEVTAGGSINDPTCYRFSDEDGGHLANLTATNGMVKSSGDLETGTGNSVNNLATRLAAAEATIATVAAQAETIATLNTTVTALLTALQAGHLVVTSKLASEYFVEVTGAGPNSGLYWCEQNPCATSGNGVRGSSQWPCVNCANSVNMWYDANNDWRWGMDGSGSVGRCFISSLQSCTNQWPWECSSFTLIDCSVLGSSYTVASGLAVSRAVLSTTI